MIGKTLAHYQISELLGKGGMGEVYRAHDSKLKRDVALKILPRETSGDPERASRFEREAHTLASLQHPNIASIYGYEEADGIRFLAMELVEGEDLSQRLARGALSIDEAIAIALQIAIGLEAAHERNIVHRDLKPANVKLSPDGSVKILDFGLARAMADDPTDGGDLATSPTITAAMTQAGVILGTAAYMSPEQARGKPIDKRSDIWSFGVMFHEMLTGQQLFSGETVTDILGLIVHSKPSLEELPKNTPPAVKALLRRCLSADSQERLRDIGEARYTLSKPQAPASEAQTQTTGKAPRAWMLATAIFAITTIAIAARLWFSEAPEPEILQASIRLPEGHSLQSAGPRGGSLRLSPDGSAVAFVAQQEGSRQIWIRSFDEREARPVQGTTEGHRPFWSPDGRHIGFFANGSLRRVSITGGAPLALADAPNGRGAAWLPDGTIVFAPTPSSDLFAVSAAGGEVRQITDRGSHAHREPRPLPLPGRFLFIEDSGGGDWTIKVGNIDGSDPVEVATVHSTAVYAQGHLLFLRGRTLIAQPFDLATLKLTGEPAPLAENVIRDPNFGIGVFSASENGTLCYQSGSGIGAQLLLLDRAGQVIGSIGDHADYVDLALSPDETTIAATIDDVEGNSDIWMIDIERGTRRRFTFTPDNENRRRAEVMWSPDGELLVYSAESDGRSGLYTKRTDGSGGEELLLQIPDRSVWPYDISHDGKYVLYGRTTEGTSEDLWIVPLSGEGEPEELFATPFDDWPGTFSPNGRWVAVDTNEAGRREIYVIPFPNTGGRWQISRDGGRFPRWKADGSELYFIDPEGTLMAVPVDGTGDTFRAQEPQPLFQRDSLASGSFGSSDVDRAGERFIVRNQAAQYSPISLFMNWKQSLEIR